MKQIFCTSITRWKRRYVSVFLTHEGQASFFDSSSNVKRAGFNSNSVLVTWASKDQSEEKKLALEFLVSPWYIEDGFIRSTGLGTDLTAPASLVLDKKGIYYDPSSSCDLEINLEHKQFTQSELKRAKLLKNSLIENELSKYNLGVPFAKDALASELIIILIPGQVEDDASIKKGCVDIYSNESLILAVREANKDSFIIYKPHPDVVSGNRKGKVAKQVTDNNVNLVLTDASITDCLDVADEVHTMTSLVGFEALMRGLRVSCYGLPFYSNWGLTDDRHKLSRRTRKLTIDELVAGALIDYPLYMNWQTNQLTTPEIIIEQLKKKIDSQGGKKSNQVFPVTRFIRKVINFLIGVYSVK